MTDELIHLLYYSSAKCLLTSEQIQAILAVSRRNNAGLGITGLLLYVDGNFVQLIEGPQPSVRTLMQAIENDPRHRGIVVAAEGPLAERQFPQWHMGFVNLDAPGNGLDGFSDFLEARHPVDLEAAPVAYRLLLSFRRFMMPWRASNPPSPALSRRAV